MEYIFLILTFSKLLADVKKRIKIKKLFQMPWVFWTRKLCVPHSKLLPLAGLCLPCHTEKQVGLMGTSQHRLESFSSSGRAMRFSGTDGDQKQWNYFCMIRPFRKQVLWRHRVDFTGPVSDECDEWYHLSNFFLAIHCKENQNYSPSLCMSKNR